MIFLTKKCSTAKITHKDLIFLVHFLLLAEESGMVEHALHFI